MSHRRCCTPQATTPCLSYCKDSVMSESVQVVISGVAGAKCAINGTYILDLNYLIATCTVTSWNCQRGLYISATDRISIGYVLDGANTRWEVGLNFFVTGLGYCCVTWSHDDDELFDCLNWSNEVFSFRSATGGPCDVCNFAGSTATVTSL